MNLMTANGRSVEQITLALIDAIAGGELTEGQLRQAMDLAYKAGSLDARAELLGKIVAQDARQSELRG